jgi:2-aminoadipate transaminase
MNIEYAKRMKNTHKSFIREILKATVDPEIISFAGGLPNPASFPVEEIEKATNQVLSEDGRNALQYSTTEGYKPLRQYIADRYKNKKGLNVSADEILITNGSQQALDLICKVLIDKNDGIVIERPGYLGAIQVLSMYEPKFYEVPLCDDGINTDVLKDIIKKYNPKLYYSVPNFQNPTGITYSKEKRMQITDILKDTNTIMVEDDPYGELRFIGDDIQSTKAYLDDNVILLGSFSKIVSPGMRLGWICAMPDIMEKLVIAKQASDLHTNYFSQRVIYQYLINNDLDKHIEKIKCLYKQQRNTMLSMIDANFPSDFKITRPEGGMFLWVEMPKEYSAIKLFDISSKEKVVFVPGNPFYLNVNDSNTMRLNYTNSSDSEIEIGIKRLADSIAKYSKQ